jgi:hypothetical protein
MKQRWPMLAPGWISIPVSQRPIWETKRPSHLSSPQPMCHAMNDQRVEPWVAGEHLPRRARGRVALEYHRDFFFQAREHLRLGDINSLKIRRRELTTRLFLCANYAQVF